PFPIAGPNNAVPGAIAAFSRNPDQMDVFWVGPDGGVGSNFWNLEFVARTTGDQLDFEFRPITFGDGVPVGGFAHLTMSKSGNCRFTGHLHDSGALEFNLQVAVAVKDSEGMVYTLQRQGHVSGTFQPGSRDDDWDVSVQNDQVAQRWSRLADGSTAHLRVDADGDLVNLTNAAIGAAGLALGVISLFSGGDSGPSGGDQPHGPS
ncbi:hypothetical protein, partial [Streptomyces sp. KR55]|uniref:hypothetical protein n=1 Tax=Streptomyces sp. KR55 TaxID=3457425 RepID=UPI003FD13E31